MATAPKPVKQADGPLSVHRALRLLVVEDTATDAELMVARLKRAGYALSFDIVEMPATFQERLQSSEYDLVISDHNLRSWSGLDALAILKESGKTIPFIVVTGTLGDEAAVDYIKRGAADYVLKDRLDLLPLAVNQSLKEKAHREQEARLHERIFAAKREWELTFDSVPDAVLIIDDQRRVQRANRAASELLGKPFPELIGQPCYQVLHGLQEPPPNCPHERLLNTGQPQHSDHEEFRLGKTFDVTSTPLRNNNGAVGGCIHVLRDISDRNRAEQELRHSLERYRSLIVATSQVVWSANAEGSVVDDLPTWREFTGMTMAQTSGQGWLDAVHPDDRGRVADAWSAAVSTGSAYAAEFKVRRKDGEYRDALVRGVPVMGNNGEIKEWVGTCTDITDQRILEEQFRQAQKMEAMGRLAGGVSHDFNNILGVIIGYSDLLLTALAPSDPLRQQVQQIKKAGYRAASLTSQMLAFSRKQVLTPKVLDLNTVVSETSKMLVRILGEDVELTVKLHPALGSVKADPTQIQQVLMNLAINARDAMPGGGKLLIETSNTTLDEQEDKHQIEIKPGGYIVLSVSDTGTGMDKQTQTHIFEPFFTTKEVGKGTGLGLATVYGIVKQSGGHVFVESELGSGSKFRIYLPRVAEAQERIAPEPPAIRLLGSGTILLVEDEDELRKLTHQLIENMGYTVMDAANGSEAIRIASQCRDSIRLLITDVVMPGMSGRELAELLVKTNSQMKVLYVSGHTDDVILQYAILKPGVAFLQKPFNHDSLAKKIQEVLGARSDRADKQFGTYR